MSNATDPNWAVYDLEVLAENLAALMLVGFLISSSFSTTGNRSPKLQLAT